MSLTKMFTINLPATYTVRLIPFEFWLYSLPVRHIIVQLDHFSQSDKSISMFCLIPYFQSISMLMEKIHRNELLTRMAFVFDWVNRYGFSVVSDLIHRFLHLIRHTVVLIPDFHTRHFEYICLVRKFSADKCLAVELYPDEVYYIRIIIWNCHI